MHVTSIRALYPGTIVSVMTQPWHFITHEHASPEAYESRIEVCRGCPHFGGVSQRCWVCGCFMPVKARIADAVCPVGRWGAVSPAGRRSRRGGSR